MAEDDFEGMTALETLHEDASYFALLGEEEASGQHDEDGVNTWYWGDEAAGVNVPTCFVPYWTVWMEGT